MPNEDSTSNIQSTAPQEPVAQDITIQAAVENILGTDQTDVNEFSYRHNTAKVDTMDFIAMTISRMNNKRLTYKELINA